MNSIGPIQRADGTEYDKTLITPYSYRHSYAQRHADTGIGIDVLRELMDHASMDATKRHFRVGETRRRQAVDKVTAMQFDRHGNRVWRDAQALLDSEHARYSLGAVAVPYGTCTQPANVAAGGGACPVRFRCVGCDHFRTDVSTCPTWSATSTTCCAPVNAWPPPSTESMSGPVSTPRPPRRRSAGSGT